MKDNLIIDNKTNKIVYTKDTDNGILIVKLDKTDVSPKDVIKHKEYVIDYLEDNISAFELPEIVNNWNDKLDYLTLIPIEKQGATFGVGEIKTGSSLCTIYYQINDGEWISKEGGDFEVFVPYGSYIKLKGKIRGNIGYILNGNSITGGDAAANDTNTLVRPIEINSLNNEKYFVAGTIMSLLEEDDMFKYTIFNLEHDRFNYRENKGFLVFHTPYNKCNGNNNNGNVVKILNPNNFLSTGVHAPHCCYYNMFKNCKYLINSPVLWINNLYGDEYNYMFDGCESLRKIIIYTNYLDRLYTHDVNFFETLGNSVKNNKGLILVNSSLSINEISNNINITDYLNWTVSHYIPYEELITENVISFKIGVNVFYAKEEMTWEEWVNSEYNTINAYIKGNLISMPGIDNIALKGYYTVYKTDVIIKDAEYIYLSGGAGD